MQETENDGKRKKHARKVKYMKMITRIAWQNMKYYKRRNILIGIAILLTTLLLFLIPSIGKIMMDSQFAMVNRIYPCWHALYRNVDQDTVNKLAAHHDISAYGLRCDAGEIPDDDSEIMLMHMDEEGFRLYKMGLESGTFPIRENDIVVSRNLLAELGQTGEIGDTITVPYQMKRDGGLDFQEESEFVISGFVADGEENPDQKIYTAFISEAFIKSCLSEDEIRYRFLFQTGSKENVTTEDVESTIKKIAAQMNISEDDTNINEEYLSANYIDPSILPIIIGIIFIIIAAGIITIYSIFYVGIPERIREFGKLKAIGATKKQMKQIVLREGFVVACLAIPCGLLLGSGITKLVTVFLASLSKEGDIIGQATSQVLSDGTVVLFHWYFYLLAAVVAFGTVWVSLKKPMRIAGRVSEMEAIRYQTESKSKQKNRKSYRNISVPKLSKIYLFGNKKNSIITIISMSITGIFIMIVATVLTCADPRESASMSVFGQYTVDTKIEEGNKEHPERAWNQVIKNNPLTPELKEALIKIPGINKVSHIKEVRVEIAEMDGENRGIGGISEEYADILMDGITEGNVTYEELKTGKKVILENLMKNWYPNLKIGDQLTMRVLDGSDKKYEVEIAAFGEYEYGFMNSNFMLMAEEGIEKLSTEQIMGAYFLFAEESYDKTIENEIKQLVGDTETLRLTTWQSEYEGWKATVGLVALGCYIFLGILGGICIMNMVNTMIHSVHRRKREIGMIQAVGMTEKQLKQMLTYEGLFYTIGTLLLSIGGGSLLGYPVFLWAKSEGLFNITKYHYPLLAAIIVAAVLTLIQMFLAIRLSKSVKKEALIERIRYSE